MNKKKEEDEEIFHDYMKDIWEAAEQGSLPAVKYYFRENPKNVHSLNKKDHNLTPLHYACTNGNFLITKFLISKKVKIDVVSKIDTTPLMCASANGRLSIIDLLIDNGADVNHRDKDNWTALHWAVYFRDVETVKKLITRGADKTIRSIRTNEIPLDIAIRYEKMPIIECLSSF